MAGVKKRCELGHSWFLRSMIANRPEGKYEYECFICPIEHIFSDIELRPFPKHPLCEKGEHRWTLPCACCQPGVFECSRRPCVEQIKITPESITEYNRQIDAEVELERS